MGVWVIVTLFFSYSEYGAFEESVTLKTIPYFGHCCLHLLRIIDVIHTCGCLPSKPVVIVTTMTLDIVVLILMFAYCDTA